MKKRILLLFCLVIAASGLVGVGTYAYFSNSVQNSNNNFQAGTLSIQVLRDMGDPNPGPLFYTEGPSTWKNPTGVWAPGDIYHRILIVKKTGTLAPVLNSVQASLTSGSRALADKLQVKITTDLYGNDVIASGTMGQFIDTPQVFTPAINVAYMKQLHFWVTFPADADNAYQGETLQAAFTVMAGQVE